MLLLHKDHLPHFHHIIFFFFFIISCLETKHVFTAIMNPVEDFFFKILVRKLSSSTIQSFYLISLLSLFEQENTIIIFSSTFNLFAAARLLSIPAYFLLCGILFHLILHRPSSNNNV